MKKPFLYFVAVLVCSGCVLIQETQEQQEMQQPNVIRVISCEEEFGHAWAEVEIQDPTNSNSTTIEKSCRFFPTTVSCKDVKNAKGIIASGSGEGSHCKIVK